MTNNTSLARYVAGWSRRALRRGRHARHGLLGCRRKTTLEAEIAGAPEAAPRLHPSIAEVYRQKVATLQDALAGPATRTAGLEILRSLIDRVEITAAENGFAIELVGEIANMVMSAAEVVAELR